MTQSVRGSFSGQRRRPWVGFFVALLLPPLAAPWLSATAVGAPAVSQPSPAPSRARAANGGSRISQVTIQATRKLRLKVDHFVAAAIEPPPSHESLMRWDKPVCPLVVGLPRNMGEFILARISQAAREARAPLAGRHCQPNLFVVVTPHPNQVLKEWMARNPKVNTRHGLAPLQRFLHSTRPVRVWYNEQAGCSGPVNHGNSAAELSSVIAPGASSVPGASGSASPGTAMGPVRCDNAIDTHLILGNLRAISYAIVVADTRQLHRDHVTLGQLAGYVSLVGLADVRVDTDGGGVPTILRLFHGPKAPQGLTKWDRALLYSLYTTSQSDMLQLNDMEVSMVRRIAP
jgi:hypothetical protein